MIDSRTYGHGISCFLKSKNGYIFHATVYPAGNRYGDKAKGNKNL